MTSPARPPEPTRRPGDVPLHPEADRLYRCALALVALAMRIFFRRTIVRAPRTRPSGVR